MSRSGRCSRRRGSSTSRAPPSWPVGLCWQRSRSRPANKLLVDDGLTTLPDGLTLHALRRTSGSLLIAIGRDPAYVMAQIGHTDPSMTLGLYAKAMSMAEGDRDRLRQLVNGGYLAVDGSGADLTTTKSLARAQASRVNSRE